MSVDDARCLLEDNGAMSVEELVYAVTDGNYKKISLYANRAAEEGVSSIVIIRAIQRHLYRLYQVSQAVQSGKNIADAMDKVGKEGVITVEDGSGLPRLHLTPDVRSHGEDPSSPSS